MFLMTQTQYDTLKALDVMNDERLAAHMEALEKAAPGSEDAEKLLLKIKKFWKRRDCLNALYEAYAN